MTSVINNSGVIKLRPSIWQFVIDHLPMLGLVITGYVYAGITDMPLTKVALIISLILTIGLLYRLQWYRRLSYRITDEQILIRKGVFTRCHDFIELYRVVDFHEHQSPMQQMLGLKTVSIYSGDRTNPRLDIIGMSYSINLVDIVRALVEKNRKRKGIYEITNR